MSSNTQAQGRTLFTERGFSFTPRTGVTGWGPAVGDDANRSLYRWESALQDQLNVGNPIFDATEKQRLMAYGPGSAGATASPASVTGVALTKDSAISAPGVLLATISTGVPASVSSTSGVVPTGTTLAIVGQTVRLTGTATGTGGFTFTAAVVTDNGTVSIPVTGTVNT